MHLISEILNFIENKLKQHNQVVVKLLTNDSHDIICVLVENDKDRLCKRIEPSEYTLIINTINIALHRKFNVLQEFNFLV